MRVTTDETMALTVAEATMQEFLAAVLLAAREPAPVTTVRLQPARPLIEYPVARRAASRPAPARAGAPRRSDATSISAQSATPTQVAGARAAYWMLLAGALAVFVLN